MNIIRDEEFGGIMMIPLFHDWGIRRCNQEGCREKPTTIIGGASKEVPAFGLCEKHYQQGREQGGTKYQLVFDDYNAFKEEL